MTINRTYLIGVLAATALSMTGPAASAHVGTDVPAASSSPYTQLARRAISASEAKSIARSHVRGGRVVDISRNGDVYRVRVIAKDGRVVDVYIDANTGRVRR